jgi:hypothetical protein
VCVCGVVDGVALTRLPYPTGIGVVVPVRTWLLDQRRVLDIFSKGVHSLLLSVHGRVVE